MLGAKRFGGAASPISDAGMATSGMTRPPEVKLESGETPILPEWLPDSGTTPSDPDDDFVFFPRDALVS